MSFVQWARKIDCPVYFNREAKQGNKKILLLEGSLHY